VKDDLWPDFLDGVFDLSPVKDVASEESDLAPDFGNVVAVAA
jgi:hypothetical protein